MEDRAIGGTLILCISAFGLFGNVNIVVATLRKPQLRSKCGILICLMAVYDTICLLFEVGSGIRMVSRISWDRQTCFKANGAYFCVQMVSAS
uniref:G_PROTEIN_RECEP_F1_2 domain-containing protein n=1 Tax=Steinernema glaseri TaxID=37863 RepID=A0A1I7Y111_9BILA